MSVLLKRGPAEATEAIQRALRGVTAGNGAIPPVSPNTTRSPGQASDPLRRDAPGANPASHFQPVWRAHAPAAAPATAKGPGHFSTHRYVNLAGQRDYKLYVPAAYAGEPLPLVVMLHGCTQNADDFAAGTRMNALAESYRMIVAYPVQSPSANRTRCWNWFKPGDQSRDAGEPSLVAGITREIMDAYNVDPSRVYVAGLSAGGALAAIMVESYPELYAAAGVHSGLPSRCAHDLPSALAAMKGGGARHPAAARTAAARRPLIVFHGDADATVNIRNGIRLVEGFDAPPAPEAIRVVETGKRRCTVTSLRSRDGVDAELWTLHGAAHAWAGGSVQGSYTDPLGPDASDAMLKFFLRHPQATR